MGLPMLAGCTEAIEGPVSVLDGPGGSTGPYRQVPQFWVKQWEDRTPAREIVAWADTPQKRQLMGIHAVQGRAAWDRRDVAYLPEHQAIADAKPF